MNIKDFVTYEQALALRELGFKEECLFHYTTYKALEGNEVRGSTDWSMESVSTEVLYKSFNYFKEIDIDAPTLAQSQKWLRKEKRYSVEELYDCDDKWSYFIVRMSDGEFIRHVSDFNSPEEALSEGITECIKILNEYL